MGLLKKLWSSLYPALLYGTVHAFLLLILMSLYFYSVTDGNYGNYQETLYVVTNAALKNTILFSGIAAVIYLPLMAGLYISDRLRWNFNDGIIVRKTTITDYIIIILLGIALAFTLNIAVSYFINEFDIKDKNFDDLKDSIDNASLGLQLLVVAIIAPVVEEVIYRGLVYRRLRHSFGNISAIIASSILFGVLHGNLVQGIYASISGIVLAYIYYKKENIFLCIAYHMAANTSVVLLPQLVLMSGQELQTEDIGAASIGFVIYVLISVVMSIAGLVYLIRIKVDKDVVFGREMI